MPRRRINRAVIGAGAIGAVALATVIVASSQGATGPPAVANGGAQYWVAIDTGEKGASADVGLDLTKEVVILNTSNMTNAYKIVYQPSNGARLNVCAGTLGVGGLSRCTVKVRRTPLVYLQRGFFQVLAARPVLMAGTRQQPVRLWKESGADRSVAGPGPIQDIPYVWQQGCATTTECPTGAVTISPEAGVVQP